jgi:hypothetical protein
MWFPWIAAAVVGVVIAYVMFGGPLMLIGLCLIGWLQLWNRPQYGFATTYAFCLLALIVFHALVRIGGLFELLEGMTLADLALAWATLTGVVVTAPILFLIVGLVIVASRRWMMARTT